MLQEDRLGRAGRARRHLDDATSSTSATGRCYRRAARVSIDGLDAASRSPATPGRDGAQLVAPTSSGADRGLMACSGTCAPDAEQRRDDLERCSGSITATAPPGERLPPRARRRLSCARCTAHRASPSRRSRARHFVGADVERRLEEEIGEVHVWSDVDSISCHCGSASRRRRAGAVYMPINPRSAPDEVKRLPTRRPALRCW